MLNVPDAIKALCKADSTRKNFRVHFPNGENSDLTNDDIIANSVKFTESVSSKDVLKFGLAEASRIEFECVNVSNIYGYTIECSIEIDTSSLTSTEIAEIQADEGDGALVLEASSDIGYGFYRVPYGTFTVTSCPRSAGAMWRRRVEGYGRVEREASEFLSQKLNVSNDNQLISQNVPCLIAGEKNSISELSTTSTILSFSSGSWAEAGITWEYAGYEWLVEFENNVKWQQATVTNPEKSLIRLTCDINTSSVEYLYAYYASAYGMTPEAWTHLRGLLIPSLSLDSVHDFKTPIAYNGDSGFIYPYYNGNLACKVQYPTDFNGNIYIKRDGLIVDREVLNPFATNVVCTQYTLSDSFLSLLNIQVKQTSSNPSSVDYRYVGSMNINDVIEGMSELRGQFTHYNRLNESANAVLSKSNPISVDTSEYSDMWWDEYDVDDIGSITVTYYDVDLGAEQTILYEFGDGLSTYDMTDNYVLKNLNVSASDLSNQTVEEYVKELLDTYFIPNIQDIDFTPVELSALGLPYLEAGDYLVIDNGDNGTVGTYILNRTISGEQFLEDDISASGGEIIGNVRSV